MPPEHPSALSTKLEAETCPCGTLQRSTLRHIQAATIAHLRCALPSRFYLHIVQVERNRLLGDTYESHPVKLLELIAPQR